MIKFWRTRRTGSEPDESAPEVETPAAPAAASPSSLPQPPVLPAAAPPAVAPVVAAEPAPAAESSGGGGGWLGRLRAGLAKSSNRLSEGIAGIFTRTRLDAETLEELEELLIRADLGPAAAAKLTEDLSDARLGKEVTSDEVRGLLADEIQRILEPVAIPLEIEPGLQPQVILMVGVNGTGKTTTIGKLAEQLRREGKSVMLAACDTFRAAAVGQLQVWGERAGCPVVTGGPGADAAGLAFEAYERARRERIDVLLIDTAGRLQNKTDLMAELQKIVRVLKKLDPELPHNTILTLDATTGQNAHAQVEVFLDMVQITGLVLTKLDGSARGGVLVGLANRFALPVHMIGVGEGLGDLRPFEPHSFARALLGLPA